MGKSKCKKSVGGAAKDKCAITEANKRRKQEKHQKRLAKFADRKLKKSGE